MARRRHLRNRKKLHGDDASHHSGLIQCRSLVENMLTIAVVIVALASPTTVVDAFSATRQRRPVSLATSSSPPAAHYHGSLLRRRDRRCADPATRTTTSLGVAASPPPSKASGGDVGGSVAATTQRGTNNRREDGTYYDSSQGGRALGEESHGRSGASTPPGQQQRITLTRYLTTWFQDRPKHREMESLSLSIQMACKTISNLVHRAGINQLSMPSDCPRDQFDVRMNSMKKLDQLSTNVLQNALRFTGKLHVVAPAKEPPYPQGGKGKTVVTDAGPAQHQPGVLIASALDSRYVAVFDPLDGSGNADAAICTGTVFGVFETPEQPPTDDANDDDDGEGGVDNVVVGSGDSDEPSASEQRDGLVNAVLQEGRKLVAAGYCLYSSATILVFTLGAGTHGFTLDPQINEFVLTHPNIRIPQRGNVYSCNEANSEGWDDDLKSYLRALKTGQCETGERYALRYVGSMVGDIHRTLMYGGIFCYPADNDLHPRGNIQLLYKSAPMAYIIEQAGGKSSNGKRELLDVRPSRVHERSPCYIGSPEDIHEMKKYVKHDE